MNNLSPLPFLKIFSTPVAEAVLHQLPFISFLPVRDRNVRPCHRSADVWHAFGRSHSGVIIRLDAETAIMRGLPY